MPTSDAALMDTSLPPQPEGGWSCSLRQVERAVVAHVPKGYLVHPSGVFDAAGTYVPEAVHWRGRPLMVPPPYPDVTAPLPGRWLWGGVLMEHFGHFLTESTGRLWALQDIEAEIDGIVFLPERGFGSGETLALKSYQRDFFDLLGIRLPVRILTQATTIDKLDVPGPGFGIGPLLRGTELARAFFQARLGAGIEPVGSDRLYISRSRLDVRLGGVLGEKLLERCFADAGYEIYHPQDHSLRDQIARYRAARCIVGLDGSALHLVALVARKDQKVALIKRRKGSAPEGIERNLTGFMGHPPTVVDAITCSWVRSDRGRADNYSYGELDFTALSRKLVADGFLDATADWKGLSPRRVEGAIAWLEKKMKRKGLTFASDRADVRDQQPRRERAGRAVRKGMPESGL